MDLHKGEIACAMNRTVDILNRKILLFLFVLMLVFSGCGKETLCYICSKPISDGEHTISANNADFDIDQTHIQQDDVICEDCQLAYRGFISGHCQRCLKEYSEDDLIYFNYDSEFSSTGVCDSCATALWGDAKADYLRGETCSVCGVSLDGIESDYPGVCKFCAKIVYG